VPVSPSVRSSLGVGVDQTLNKLVDVAGLGQIPLSEFLGQFGLGPALVPLAGGLTRLTGLGPLGGAVRQHVDAVGEALRDQIQAVSHTAKEQVDKVAAAEREAIEVTGRKQIEATERAQAAERAKVRERYEGRTKAELAEELGQRDLPKTGNIDELIERLVDADTQ
jgi:hypothetical protein